MADATRLYSSQVLALATSLADWPWDPDLPLQTTVRSRSCGSTLSLALALDGHVVTRLGMKPQACAIGQASAAIFAGHAVGRSAGEILTAARQVTTWLSGGGALPDWPGFDAIAAARGFPGRHGAILLPWQAACELLPTR